MVQIELLLGLLRITFLKTREKIYLAKKLDNIQSLAVLSIEDISYIVQRNIRSSSWNGKELHEMVEKDLDIIEKYGTSVTFIGNTEFPPLLREVPDPPFGIFWRGNLPDPECPLVAIVGTRAPTGDGSLGALKLGKDFAEAGIGVVSGLARGIDAFAHRGNLDGGGSTVAVLACGVEQIYPRSNANLASRILDNGGCILSEYSPGELPLKYRFPQRNRLISGLARTVIVVEAPEKSGALITADFALEQGRDLAIYKGCLTSSRGSGTRRMHSEGAQAIASAKEILNDWGYSCKKTVKFMTPISQNVSPSVSVGRQLAFEFKNEIIQCESNDR